MEICIASRTVSKCDAFKRKVEGEIKSKNHDRAGRCGQSDGPGRTYQESTAGRCIKIWRYRIRIWRLWTPVWRLAYIMLIQQITSRKDTAKFEYKWQWAYREKYEKAGITALLGSGFDPGVTSVFSA